MPATGVGYSFWRNFGNAAHPLNSLGVRTTVRGTEENTVTVQAAIHL